MADSSVVRLSTEYDVRGLPLTLSSADDPDVGQGNLVNQVAFAYKPFGQPTKDQQSHDGAVNVSTTPKVQYGYADGSANMIRPSIPGANSCRTSSSKPKATNERPDGVS